MTQSAVQPIDVNAVIEAALRFHQYDFPRHTAAVVEEEKVIYPHVWEMVKIQGVETLFATDTGRLFVKKKDAPPDTRSGAIILREVTEDEALEILEAPEVSRFLSKYGDLLDIEV
jgi:hypothetical protein